MHIQNKDGNNKDMTYSTGVPSSMYVGNDVAKAPTTIHAHPTQFGSDNVRTNEPTTNCE